MEFWHHQGKGTNGAQTAISPSSSVPKGEPLWLPLSLEQARERWVQCPAGSPELHGLQRSSVTIYQWADGESLISFHLSSGSRETLLHTVAPALLRNAWS